MITKLLLVLKKWALPIVLIYVIALTIGSLLHPRDIPLMEHTLNDKINHVLAYFLFTLLVYNYCNSKNFKSSIMISVLFTSVYGIILELLQNSLTSYRIFDAYDVVANTSGALLAVIVLRYLIKTKVKMN